MIYVNKIDNLCISSLFDYKLYNILQDKMNNRKIYGNRNTCENLF